MPKLVDRIENDFSWRPPDPDQCDRYHSIRREGKALALLIAELCPESRELSIALTKIEEAVMWANASIARNMES